MNAENIRDAPAVAGALTTEVTATTPGTDGTLKISGPQQQQNTNTRMSAKNI